MTTRQAQKPNRVLGEVIVSLWKNVKKEGEKTETYFTGKGLTGKGFIGYWVSYKQNPKEPDMRIYERNSDGSKGNVFLSLWGKVAKNGNKYLSGKLNDRWVIAFIDKDANEENKHPYIKVYYQEPATPVKLQDDDMPF